MEPLDPAREWQRLSELYRGMSEEELLNIARQYSELTGTAQQVLERELQSRGLKIPEPDPDQSSAVNIAEELDPESRYAEDRKLVELTTVWSARDALQLKDILDTAGIPFVLGEEKANSVESVKSNFSDGVSVHIMKIAVPIATAAMKYYAPADAPETTDEAPEEFVTRCPKCHSEEVVFGDPSAEPETLDDTPEKFEWSCEACGYKWEDDGVQAAGNSN